MKKCGNCINRFFAGWDGPNPCMGYDMACSEEDEIRTAADCLRYKEGTPSCIEADEYTPSATNRDYGPGNPWDAPGMSIKDFI